MSAVPASPATPAPALPLHDIHLPATPGWWPPAPGWWLLAALVAIVLFFATRWLLRRWRLQRWRTRVRGALDRIAASHAAQPDSVRLATEISNFLRRVTLSLEPAAAALKGEAWLDFLDARMAPEQSAAAPFRSGAGRALLELPYRRAAADDQQAQALLELSRRWLDAVLKAGQTHV